MAEPTNILGKIGKATGDKIKALQDQVDAIDVNNVTGNVVVDGNVDGINLTATGDLAVGGHLVCDSLLVKGETKVINTTTVEVSDNILEINKSDDGQATAQSSGLFVNRGADESITTQNLFNPQTTGTVSISAITWESNAFGTLNDGNNGATSVGINVDGNLYMLPEHPTVNTALKDKSTDQYFVPIYMLTEGNVTYKIYPIFSVDRTGETFRAENGEDAKFTDLTEAYLRGYYVNYADDTGTLETQIQSINYLVTEKDKAQFYWDNITEKWQIKLGSELTDIEGNFHTEDGDGIQINGASIGTYADFKSELEIALNTTTLVCTPIAVEGFYPLYTSVDCATQAGDGSYHEHTLSDQLYYMPNGVDYWHGNYGGYSDPYFADNATYTQTKAQLDTYQLDPVTDVTVGSLVRIIESFVVYGEPTTEVQVGDYFIVEAVEETPTRITFDVNGVSNVIGQRGTKWELVHIPEGS